MKLILASQSPRRRELLSLFRIPFSVKVADIDEKMNPQKDPASEVADVSLRKARAIGAMKDTVVVAADTIVVCSGRIMGKPKNAAEAEEMLKMLSGRSHQVMTGLSVITENKEYSCTEITEVYFRELQEDEIRAYIATGEPMDKAGAYGIQGGAALFTQKIDGDYYNVMGLPVCKLGQILSTLIPDWKERIR